MNEKFFERKIAPQPAATENIGNNDLAGLKTRIIEKHQLLEREVLQNQLGKLRETVHREMKKEIEERIKNNPKPTEEEIRMAAFDEELEPQVRDAVRDFYKKGYSTKSSGFYGEKSELQAIDGYFYVDENTEKEIEKLGARVLQGLAFGVPKRRYITQIGFYPAEADLQKIKQKWDAIANALPKIAGPEPICDNAEEFRKQHAPNHPNLKQKIHDYDEWLKTKIDKIYGEEKNSKINRRKKTEKTKQEILEKYDKDIK